jgi:hypothetical protein
MGFSRSSPNISDVDRAIVDITEYMKHYVKNTQGMEPIVNEDPIDDAIHMRKTGKHVQPS